jgi:outer membrane protein TolC
MGNKGILNAQVALMEPEIRVSIPPLDELLERAPSRRMDLKALEESLQAANAAMDGARSGYLPEVYLTAAQEWNSPTVGLRHGNSMLGAVVKMNLFAGGADRARIQAAVAGQSSVEARIENKKLQIANEIRQAWRAVQIADKQVRTRREALIQRKESLRIKEIRHQQGLETTSELLDAQARLDTARENNIRAGYDAVLARVALLLASGNLNEGVVKQ